MEEIVTPEITKIDDTTYSKVITVNETFSVQELVNKIRDKQQQIENTNINLNALQWQLDALLAEKQSAIDAWIVFDN